MKINSNAKHVYVCVLIAFILGALSYKFADTTIILSMIVGFISALLAGVTYEFVWDKWMKKGIFNRMDIFYDFWGALIGSLILGGILNTFF